MSDPTNEPSSSPADRRPSNTLNEPNSPEMERDAANTPSEPTVPQNEKATSNNLDQSASLDMEKEASNASSDSDSSHGDENNTAPTAMTFTRILAILSLAACFTGSQIANLLVGPGLNFIADGLHLGAERSWIVVSGTLASAIIVLSAGYIQDMIGRRTSLALSLLFVIIGDTVAATSNGFAQIIAGSVIKGIGSGVLELTSIAAVAELVPAKRRGYFLALNICLTAGFAPAVLYAQLIGNDWPWLYWISLIWNAVAVVGLSLSYFRMKLNRLSKPSDQVSWKHFDWIGILLVMLGLTLFLVGLQSGGRNGHDWDSAYVLVLLILGIVVLGTFIFWETRNPRRPLVPMRLFQGQRVVGIAVGLGAVGGANYSTILNLGPTIIQASFQETHTQTGLIALGPGLALVVGAVVSNVLISKLKPHSREILTVGAVIMTAFSGAQACITPEISTTFAVLASFAALGIGIVIIPLTTLVTLACPQDLIGTAVALAVTVRSVGGAIGYTILYNIFTQKAKTTIVQQMAPRLAAAGLPRDEIRPFIEKFRVAVTTGDFKALPHATGKELLAAVEGFRWGITDAASYVYYALIAFGSVAIILSLCLPNMKKFMTDKVLVKMSSRKNSVI